MPRTVDPALVEQYEEKKKRRPMSSQAVGDDDGRVAQPAVERLSLIHI